MRLTAATALVLLGLGLVAAGCGGTSTGVATTTTRATATIAAASPSRLRVGVVGPLQVTVPGVKVVHGSLARLPGLPLVLVSGSRAEAKVLAAVAQKHTRAHYALVGASTESDRQPNLAGLVFREDQAARLAGLVAGQAVSDGAGATALRVAWVGPQERPLATAAARGLHAVSPGATMLRQWTSRVPARCKEGALAAIGRGATVVIAHGGLCGEAVVNAAHEQGLVGLQLGDFELPSIAANWVASEAEHGIYHGDGDVVFGLRSGALGVRRLDPAIPAAAAIRARAAVQELVGGLSP
jgi:hypothetical protein